MKPTGAQDHRRGDFIGKRLGISRLQLKLWLGVGASLLIGLAVLQIDHYRAARADAMEAILMEARILRTVLMASSGVYHQSYLKKGLPAACETIDLLPTHALARIAGVLEKEQPAELRIRVVGLERLNQDQRPDDSDVDAIAYFKRNPTSAERLAQVATPDGQRFYHYAQPIWTEAFCLTCHGDPQNVPANIRDRYSPASGFHEGDLRGIMSLWLPIDHIEQRTFEHFIRSLRGHLAVFLVMFIVGGVLLQRFVINQLRQLQAAAHALASGQYGSRATVTGHDELADLATTFNRMADSIELRDQQLAGSEERLRLFIGYVPVALAMFDHDMRYLAVSRRWLIDYRVADVIGRSHYELFPDLPERWKDAHRRGLAGEVVQEDEDRFERSDGRVQWAHWAVRPWYRYDGTIGGIILFTEDITERKLAEEALTRANCHNRALLEASLDPMVVINPDGRISDVNLAAEQATGYGREQLIGSDSTSYFSDPDLAMEGYRIAFERGQVRDLELELIHRDGTTTPVLYNAAVYRDHAGAVEQVFAAARDVTNLKRITDMLKARLRLLDGAASRSLDEVLRASVDEAAALTDSAIGFYHFLEPDQETLVLQTWSTRTTREFCQAEGAGLHYPLSEGGVWADCVRQRRAIIHNDYASLPQRRGLPPGHAEVTRELVVPVFRDERIVAILGVGNKPRDYDETDLKLVTTFADLAWDIVEEKLVHNALWESEARYREIIQVTNEGIWAMNTDHLTTFVNPRMAALLGYASGEMLGRPVEDFMFAEDLEAHGDRMQARHQGQHEQYERRFRRKDDSELWTLVTAVALYDTKQGFDGSFAMLTDITQIKEQQRRLEQMAHFDPLTGLPNRTLLTDRLRIALAHARREECLLAVCYLDLDGFKPVNDTHGHAAGDRLLIAVAGRLTQSVREGDTVARLGGDEFVLLMGNLTSREEGEHLLTRLLTAIAEPYAIDAETTVAVSASIGVTLYPLDQADPDTLLRHADLAMYQAKQAGRNGFRFLESDGFT
ncbi:hypothetical protein CCR95_23220 [Thiocystis minor]|uniref:PAS domain S-box protein n=1 Tax=Thiocystis minor TaxID=61597 RepID=UPI001914920E|nr:PAS domain S-box protein [Thiocystis minor]MBK5966899.1 hypothetical protein [Thiocystis minor]